VSGESSLEVVVEHLLTPDLYLVSFAGVVVEVGAMVTRFKKGDRVVTNSAGTIRNDSRFGAYQKYALTTQELTAQVSDLSCKKHESDNYSYIFGI
jgi:NADPH:quinone reductase-like Zn-dependent oxidoreductase